MDTTIWIEDNYNILFLTGKPDYDEYYKDTVYKDAEIIFKTNNYDNELAVIRENIRKGFKPNDLIKIESFRKPTFNYLTRSYPYDKEIVIEFRQFRRTGSEEPRGITDVKFNVIFKTKFNEIICTIPDCIYTFNRPIKCTATATTTHLNLYGSGYAYSFKYNSGNALGYDLLNSYMKSNIDFKTEADIISIVFEDDEVLNK